jgi:hypothetical protein
MSEGAQEKLGVALTRLVAALERVNLSSLESSERDLVEKALAEARAALQLRLVDEPFPQED